MENPEHRIRPGEFPNPVRDAAVAYFQAAEVVFESEKSRFRWLVDPNWFVVHHLSFIAVELFLKSFYAKYSHSWEGDESGPDWESYEVAYKGHNAKLKTCAPAVWLDVEKSLTRDQLALISTIETRKSGDNENSRGRYPFEAPKGEGGFPLGDKGRQLAEAWLDLARALSNVGIDADS